MRWHLKEPEVTADQPCNRNKTSMAQCFVCHFIPCDRNCCCTVDQFVGSPAAIMA
jgi:hypothetical protein